MKIEVKSNVAGIPRDELGPRHAGSVVHSWWNGSTGGPFLVCAENRHRPLEQSGCPNGEVRFFLVSLTNGDRYNLPSFLPDATFRLVNAVLNIDGERLP